MTSSDSKHLFLILILGIFEALSIIYIALYRNFFISFLNVLTKLITYTGPVFTNWKLLYK